MWRSGPYSSRAACWRNSPFLTMQRKQNKVFSCWVYFLKLNNKTRESIPFCLALLMISMCFMETLRSFCVMRDATSTCERERDNEVKTTNESPINHRSNHTNSDFLPSGFDGPELLQRNAKSPSVHPQMPRHLLRPWKQTKNNSYHHTFF